MLEMGLIVLFALIMLFLGFFFEEYVFGVSGAIILVFVGVEFIIRGWVGVSYFVSYAAGWVFIGLGLYVFVRGGLETLPDKIEGKLGDWLEKFREKNHLKIYGKKSVKKLFGGKQDETKERNY